MSEDKMLELFKRNEDFCSAMAGAVKALEYGVRTLIAAHPSPELLHFAWQELIAEIPDHHQNTSAPNPALFNATMSAVLGTLTKQIELAADQ